MDGVFNIDKPVGLTSHDVVAKVRRLVRQLSGGRTTTKVGHAGTLDPMASGVLPVVVGAATRLVEYLAAADKAYRATAMLGATSDTYDAEGTLTPVEEVPMPSRESVEAVLDSFRGEIDQVPPMHSALKVEGKKLYELARQGMEVEREPRRVTIKRLDLEMYRPPALQIYVECSKGTYIRSLAHDTGKALGTGAYLSALRRTRHGPFTAEGATTLEGLEAAFLEETWQELLYPPEYILEGMPRHTASDEEVSEIVYGRPLQLPSPRAGGELLAAYTHRGRILAILHWDAEAQLWRPRKVFPPSAEPE